MALVKDPRAFDSRKEASQNFTSPTRQIARLLWEPHGEKLLKILSRRPRFTVTMTPIQERAWEAMLTAQLNALYWSKKAFWLKIRLQLIQISAAVIGCAAFGTLFIDPAFGLFNKVLALIAAILSLVLSIFDLKGALSQAEETEKKYSILFGKFEKLWNEILLGLSEEEIKNNLAGLVDEEAEIKEPNVVTSERLKVKSYQEICAARGLLSNA